MKPVFLRYVALGDRQEAGQARLGGQQIVERVVAPLLGDAIADREDPPPVVVEKREVHRRDLHQRRGGNLVVPGQKIGDWRLGIWDWELPRRSCWRLQMVSC